MKKINNKDNSTSLRSSKPFFTPKSKNGQDHKEDKPFFAQNIYQRVGSDSHTLQLAANPSAPSNIKSGTSTPSIQKRGRPQKITYYTKPWHGRVLRASKLYQQPAQKKIVSLPKEDIVSVIGEKGKWLLVEATVDNKDVQGYISKKQVRFLRWDLEPGASWNSGLTVREAIVKLKEAEVKKKADHTYTPQNREKHIIRQSIATIKEQPKYHINESTYHVSFATIENKKIKVTTIEDFILFVEAVETQYPSASPKEVASEIRQLWFSDINWEILVGSEGIKHGGKHIDIETAPNPVAKRFDMPDLAPKKGGKTIKTRHGDVDIGHVLAGIDAQLSGSPAWYPEAFLKARRHHSKRSEYKYKTLKEFNSGNPAAFATFGGDLGQAYAEYMRKRYDGKDKRASLWQYINYFAKPAAILGDIHGYIALQVAKDARSKEISPTKGVVKISNILRDMYLLDRGNKKTNYSYLEEVSGKTGWDGKLKKYIFNEAMSFAHLWYAKRVATDAMYPFVDEIIRDFSEMADKHEANAEKKETLDNAVEKLLQKAMHTSP